MFGWFRSPPTDHGDEIVSLARTEQDRQAVDHYQQRRAAMRDYDDYEDLMRVKGDLHRVQRELQEATAKISHFERIILKLACDRHSLIDVCGMLVDQSTGDEAQRQERYQQAQAHRQKGVIQRLESPEYVRNWTGNSLRFDSINYMPFEKTKIGYKP